MANNAAGVGTRPGAFVISARIHCIVIVHGWSRKNARRNAGIAGQKARSTRRRRDLRYVLSFLMTKTTYRLSRWLSCSRSRPSPTSTLIQRPSNGGRKGFIASCGFCQGNDATGNRAPDLIRSPLVNRDAGNLIGPVDQEWPAGQKEMPGVSGFIGAAGSPTSLRSCMRASAKRWPAATCLAIIRLRSY